MTGIGTANPALPRNPPSPGGNRQITSTSVQLTYLTTGPDFQIRSGARAATGKVGDVTRRASAAPSYW